MAAGHDADDASGASLLHRASQSPAASLARKLSLLTPFTFRLRLRPKPRQPLPPGHGNSRPRRSKRPSIRLGGGAATSSRGTRSRFRFSLSGHIRRLRLRWLAAYYSRVFLARLRSLCDATARGLAEAAWGFQEAAKGTVGVAESYGAAVPVVSLPFRTRSTYYLR